MCADVKLGCFMFFNLLLDIILMFYIQYFNSPTFVFYYGTFLGHSFIFLLANNNAYVMSRRHERNQYFM